jgi:Tfp pilus assembly protein PilV
MRKIVLIVLGVIVVGVLGFVALGAWNANQTIDANNPQYAGMFKESFMKICTAEGNKAAAARNKPFTEEETARMEQICSCGAEGGLEHFKNRPNVKVMDLMTDKTLQQEINGVMEACAKKLSPQ